MITRLVSLLSASSLVYASAALAAETPPPRPLRDLSESYFPFQPVTSKAAWSERREEVQRRVKIACGLWPTPEKTPLNAVIHGRVERDDYTIDRVFFESLPGHYVTGNLYLPKNKPALMPGILCPHGHWPNGRFMDTGVGTDETRKQIDTKAEQFECGARSPLQARCVQLARMGCAVFHYDMLGTADSIQFPEHRHGATTDGFLSPRADLQLVNYFTLQSLNSARALDFLLTLEGVDKNRIGCTGASGGGTQTMMITGMDDRIHAAFPCVMPSTSMQGGCTCENSHYLRINAGNMDITALTAPRPLGMTAADDWTKELETKGFPDLKQLYTMLGVPDLVEAHYNIQFPHNYNQVAREQMYQFFNRHFKLGLTEPVREREFTFSTPEDLTVWTKEHPAPQGDQVGATHERAILDWFAQQDANHLASLKDAKELESVIGGAWETIIGRNLPSADAVTFEHHKKEEFADYWLHTGITRHLPTSEEVPCTLLSPKNWNGTAVLWLSLEGEKAILSDGKPTANAAKLLAARMAVVCPSLYLPGQTENLKSASNRKAKSGTNAFYEFSGYTYGYNPTLFAQRVHDALSMVTMMKNHPQKPAQKILIAGTDNAGAIALAAAYLGRDAVAGVAVDLQDFTFAKLTNVWDQNFVPGATKYGDVTALLKLCAPLSVKERKSREEVVSSLVP